MLKRIHHINFVVRDLDTAVKKYESLFGMKFREIEEHPERPVKIARHKIGDVWLVLVQPLDMDSVPGKILKQKGEGFFLISYEVEDVSGAINLIESKEGNMIDRQPRRGISNWRVADMNADSMFGVLTQLCEEPVE